MQTCMNMKQMLAYSIQYTVCVVSRGAQQQEVSKWSIAGGSLGSNWIDMSEPVTVTVRLPLVVTVVMCLQPKLNWHVWASPGAMHLPPNKLPLEIMRKTLTINNWAIPDKFGLPRMNSVRWITVLNRSFLRIDSVTELPVFHNAGFGTLQKYI